MMFKRLLILSLAAITSISSVDALACIPPTPGYYQAGWMLAPLPTMPPDQVVAFVHVRSSVEHVSEDAIQTYEVVNAAGDRYEGTLAPVQLSCDTNRQFYTITCSNLLVWRPTLPLPAGDYTLRVSLDSIYETEPLQLTSSFTVADDATIAPLAPPQLTATLTAIPEAGPERACCPIAQRSTGPISSFCVPEDALVNTSNAAPLGLVTCDFMEGGPCQLCWPTQLLAAPRLTARWSRDSSHPVYYKANKRRHDWRNTYGGDAGILNQYTISAERQFTAAETAQRYCMTVTAVSLIDGSEASAEVCLDHDQLTPALPAVPAQPSLCSIEAPMEPEPAMEPEPETPMEPAPMPETPMEPTPSADAPDDEGGCATPGAAPAAPLWLLVASLLARRRRATRNR